MKTKNSAEAQKTSQGTASKTVATSEEDFFGLTKYLTERAKNLNNYSDKLRENLKQIDEKIMALKLGITFADFETFAEETEETQGIRYTYKIFHGKDPDNFDGLWVLKNVEGCDFKFYIAFSNCPRWILKQLVSSGRLIKFLQLLSQKLAMEEKEYGEVAAIAEKMAKAISAPQDDPAFNTNAYLKEGEN